MVGGGKGEMGGGGEEKGRRGGYRNRGNIRRGDGLGKRGGEKAVGESGGG